MSRQVLWVNEVNYFGGTEFVEIAVPVDHNVRPGFSIVIYDAAGNVLQTINSPQAAVVGSSANQTQYLRFDTTALPDAGFGVAVVAADGTVAQFLSFGSSLAPVTAQAGAANGLTSTVIATQDTNATRGIGLTGSAAGPDGWTWTTNIATAASGGRNPGQTHTPTNSGNAGSGTGDGGNNTLIGAGANNTMDGGAGHDLIFGLAGADTLIGGEGDDVLVGGTGADALQGGNGTDTASYDTAVAAVNVNLQTGVHTGEAAGDTFSSIESYELSGFNDAFTGDANGQAIHAGAGNDTINAGGGADTIDGGAGFDVALFGAQPTSNDVAWNGSSWTVTTSDGVDTVVNVEVLDDAGGGARVLLVGGGGFATIGAALADANPGDTIMVAPGVYNENVSITESVTLVGAGPGVVIQGTFESSNGISGSVSSFLQSAPSYTGAAGNGITVSADNVTISNITVDSFLNAVAVSGASVSGLTLNDVTMQDSVFGFVKPNATALDGLTINGGAVIDGYIGVYFYNDSVALGEDATNTTIDGMLFQDLAQKGIYVETLDGTTLFDNLVMTNVGQYGGGPAFGANGANGAGIDINLKFHDYNGSIIIEDFTFTGVGSSTGTNPLGHANAAAIAVKGRDDPGHGLYGPNPANVDDLSVIIRNGTIDGTSTGIRAGEVRGPGLANVTGPAVTIENVDITNNLTNANHDQLDNRTNSVMTIEGTNDGDVYHALDSVASTGPIVFNGEGGSDDFSGGSGADSFTGGTGNDTLDGDGGIDTAFFSGSQDDYAGLFGSGTLTVTDGNVGDGDDGADTLSGIEIAQFSDGRVLIVGAGSAFTTIQAAVNAAQDGDTIVVQSGTYVEQVVVDGFTNLTITAGDGQDVNIVAPADVAQTATSSSGRALNGVVTVLNSTSVNLYGLDVDGAGAGNSVDGANANFIGVIYRNASGVVEDVDIVGMHDAYPGGVTADGYPVQSGNQRGVGLQVDNDTRLPFEWIGGSVSDFQKNGAVINGAEVTITGVTVTGGGAQTINAQNGIQVLNSTGTISNNIINDIGYAGAQVVYAAGLLVYNNDALTVTGNSVTGTNDATAASQVVGIYVFGNNEGSNISNNTIDHTDTGIGVYGNQDGAVTILNNVITNIDTNDPYAAGVDLQPDSTGPVVAVGSGFGDNLIGGDSADTLAGLGGDDYLQGGGGNDQLGGGLGNDTAGYAGAVSDYAVATTVDGQGFVTGFVSVTDNNAGDGDEGSDALFFVEELAFAGGVTLSLTDPVQLFDAGNDLIGTFTSIQDAVDASADGQTIRVAAGTYNENLVVDTSVTILGMGDGDDVVIQGTFETSNSISGDVSTFLQSAPSYTGAAGTGITVSANNVSISNITVDGFLNAVAVSGPSVSDLTLTDVTMQDSVFGFVKPNETAIDGLTIDGGAILDSYIGVYFHNSVPGSAAATDTTIDGVLFEDITQKGIYVETADGDTLFDNLTMTNVGQYGGGPAFGANGANGSGIDINLKFDTYTGEIVIEDFTFTGVGSSTGTNPLGHANAAAIAVKGRDDPGHGLYGPNPANVDDLSVIIRNGTIDGTSTGIRAGEVRGPGLANVTGPAVTIENVDITNNLTNANHDQLDNRTNSVMTIEGTNDGDVYHALDSVASTGPIVFNGEGGSDDFSGGSGADSFTGGTGNDTLDGDGGIDTAFFSGSQDDYAGLFGSGTLTVTDGNVGDGDDGADTLSGIEIAQFSDGRVLIVGAGSAFTTIQAAVNAAQDGDTIYIENGVYAGDVTIPGGLSITINGNGATVVGQITASGELDGTLAIENLNIDATGREYGILSSNTSATNGGSIVLDGVSIEGANHAGFFYAVPGNTSGPINTNTVGAIEILNSDFDNNGTSIASGNGRGHVVLFGYNGDVTIDSSTFDGDPNTQKAIQIRGVGTGADTPGVGPYLPSGNVVLNNVTLTGVFTQDAIAIYNHAGFDSFTVTNVNVTVSAPWGVFNADGVGGALDLSGLSGTNSGGAGLLTTLQGLGSAEAFTGTGFADYLFGRGGGDTLEGAGGNDTINGAAGDDTAVYSGNFADYTISLNAGIYTITDNRPGSPDGVDAVSGVEFFDFADGVRGLGDLGAAVAPTDMALSNNSFAENNVAPVNVGTFSATDANPGDTFTYTLVSGTGSTNNALFSIAGNQLVFNGTADHEAQSTYSVRVRVTDQTGLWYEEVQTINVTDVSEVPVAPQSSTTIWLNELSWFNTDNSANPDFIEVAIPVENSVRPLFQIAIYDSAGNLVDTIDSPAGASANGIQYLRFEGIDLPDTGGFGIALIRADGSVRQFLNFGMGAGTVTAVNGPASGSVSTAVTAVDNNNRSVGLTGTASGPDGWSWTSNVALALTGRNPLQNHTPQTNVTVNGDGNANTMVGTTGVNNLYGGSGNDAIFALAGNDSLFGEAGNDTLIGGAGADLLDGGADTDTASYISSNVGLTLNFVTGIHTGNAAGDTFVSIENFRLTEFNDTFYSSNTAAISGAVSGGAGNDTYYAGTGTGTHRFNGNDGDDVFHGSSATSAFNGGAGADSAFGGSGADTLNGQEGNDYLYGAGGIDSINGGTGSDTIIGGLNNDTLNGGGADGATDTFMYNFGVNAGLNEGHDTIGGFEDDVDVLNFNGALVQSIQDVGANVQVTLSTGTVITVLNMTAADIADDYVFGGP